MSPDGLSGVYRDYLAAVVRFHLVAAETGHLGPTDYQASSMLELHGPMTAGELAERIGLSRSAATRVVDRLVSAGIAARTTDEHDRRRVKVAHTGNLPEGLQKLLFAVQAPIAEAVEDLSEEQRQGLMSYFRSATDAYREGLRQAESG